MLASLAMAVAIPDAFAGNGLLFAGSYVTLQLGRSFAATLIFRPEGAARMRNMARITAWFVASAPLWIGGALASDPNLRLLLWLLALAIEYAGPMTMFRTPVLGRSSGSDWDISGSHMAERCALFIIIALGEGIVVTGSAVADAPWGAGLALALAIAFAGSALMWWLYFDLGAQRGAQLISGHAQAGRVARNAYTYLHMPIVLGVIIAAVGDALLLEHWHDTAGHDLVLVQTGGTVLFPWRNWPVQALREHDSQLSAVPHGRDRRALAAGIAGLARSDRRPVLCGGRRWHPAGHGRVGMGLVPRRVDGAYGTAWPALSAVGAGPVRTAAARAR
jgi:low temperature requirement protein LtrA